MCSVVMGTCLRAGVCTVVWDLKLKNNWGCTQARHQHNLLNLERLILLRAPIACSLSASSIHVIETGVHPQRCQSYTKLTFHWKLFIKGSLLSIKKHHKNVRTRTATNLHATPQHPEPSAPSHEEIQSTKWRNNRGRQYASVLFTVGFHSVWSFKILHPSYSMWAFWIGLSVSNWPSHPFKIKIKIIHFSLSLKHKCKHTYPPPFTHTHNIPI